MFGRELLIAVLFLAAPPQTQPRLPIHVESFTYPPLARMARIQGDIVIIALIDPEGHVTVPALSPGHPILVRAAEENIKTWRFQSGPRSELKVTYHFKVEGKPTYEPPLTVCKFDFPDAVTIVTSPGAPDP